MTDPGLAATDSSEDARISAALDQIRTLLVPGETLTAYAVQRRLFALVKRREIVAATSGRLIHMTRGLIGGFHPISIRWQDLKEARLDVGVFGATLNIVYYTSPDLAVTGQVTGMMATGLRKAGAQEVYRICQAQDQQWREKRRVRELEELRAKSVGSHLGARASASSPAAEAGAGGEADDPVSRLQRAKEMLDKHLISDSEYEALKARIVNQL